MSSRETRMLRHLERAKSYREEARECRKMGKIGLAHARYVQARTAVRLTLIAKLDAQEQEARP